MSSCPGAVVSMLGDSADRELLETGWGGGDDPTTLLPVITTRLPLAWSQWEPPGDVVTLGAIAQQAECAAQAHRQSVSGRVTRLWKALTACGW